MENIKLIVCFCLFFCIYFVYVNIINIAHRYSVPITYFYPEIYNPQYSKNNKESTIKWYDEMLQWNSSPRVWVKNHYNIVRFQCESIWNFIVLQSVVNIVGVFDKEIVHLVLTDTSNHNSSSTTRSFKSQWSERHYFIFSLFLFIKK